MFVTDVRHDVAHQTHSIPRYQSRHQAEKAGGLEYHRLAAGIGTRDDHDGVLRVEAMPPDALPGARFVLLGPALGPVQRQIGPAIVGRGWTLLEVRAETPTLEDLFVRLVRPSGHDGGR